jgi:hypothetical protein
MPVIPKVVCKSNAIIIEIPMAFFREIEKNPKIHIKAQKNPNSQSNPEQKEQCWRHHNT